MKREYDWGTETEEIGELEPGDRFRLTPDGEDRVVTARRSSAAFDEQKIETVELPTGKFCFVPISTRVLPMPSEQARLDENYKRGYKAGMDDEWLFPSRDKNDNALRVFEAGMLAGEIIGRYGESPEVEDFQGCMNSRSAEEVETYFKTFQEYERQRREKP